MDQVRLGKVLDNCSQNQFESSSLNKNGNVDALYLHLY